jgi:hypothetical protein
VAGKPLSRDYGSRELSLAKTCAKHALSHVQKLLHVAGWKVSHGHFRWRTTTGTWLWRQLSLDWKETVTWLEGGCHVARRHLSRGWKEAVIWFDGSCHVAGRCGRCVQCSRTIRNCTTLDTGMSSTRGRTGGRKCWEGMCARIRRQQEVHVGS